MDEFISHMENDQYAEGDLRDFKYENEDTKADEVISITPRRNPRRLCVKQISFSFEDEDENDHDVDIFNSYVNNDQNLNGSTPKNEGISFATPILMNAADKMLSCYNESYSTSDSTVSKKSNKKLKCLGEYDPKNDAFVHNPMKSKFCIDSLRNNIKKYINMANVSTFEFAKENISGHRVPYSKLESPQSEPTIKTTPKSPRTRKKRQTTRSSIGTDLWFTRMETPTYPRRIRTEEMERAILRAKLIMLGIAEREKMLNDTTVDSSRGSSRTPSHKFGGETFPIHPNESEILRGLMAYADVVSREDEDISVVITEKLRKLGATVASTLTKNDPVDVILFNDGRVSTYKKAKKRGIPLVSVLWIEECRRIGAVAPFDQFPPSKLERYECSKTVKQLKKRKFIYPVVGRVRKQRKRRSNAKMLITSETESSPPYEYTPNRDLHGPSWLNEIPGNNGEMRILVNISGITEDKFREMVKEPNDSMKYELSPLPLRLLFKLTRNMSENATVTSSVNDLSVNDGVPANEPQDMSTSNNTNEKLCIEIHNHENDSE